jgi:superoxide reductase
MELLKEKTQDSAIEKHVPYIEKTKEGILVKVGQNQDHPMEEKHYIEWIQVMVDNTSYRKFLRPGDKPQAKFEIKGDKIEAREYCNIHGLWKS